MTTPNEPLPDFSDVQSGSSSEAMPEEVAEKKLVTYTVVGGDSLSRIAKRYYGDASKWKLIFEANRDRIKNPDLIQIGWVLTIPELPETPTP